MTSTLTAPSSVLSWVWLEAELPLWCFPSTFAPVLTRTSIPWLSFYMQCKETHVLWPHRLSNFTYKTLRFTRSVAAHRHPRKFHVPQIFCVLAVPSSHGIPSPHICKAGFLSVNSLSVFLA
ncbi:hypothetical protein MG293_009924 [Ovis ammon polii]|uniref:Uncharacterized protein n=1 Tax=Ovis ammon polii TaxID=230172 RepID=A0AAD4Y9B5_OVIAM|nr:hypothetical protein MG293_009924 [Ovis ammon polii]